MPVSSTDTVSGPYLADGSAVSFPFTFRAVSGEEVSVLVRDSSGNDAIISREQFAVTLNGAGGSVDFFSPPVGGSLYVYSDPHFLQEIAFASGQRFLPEVVNEANDRAAVRDLVLRSSLLRGFRAPLGEDGVELPPAALRAGKAMMFDADGGVLLVDLPTDVGAGEDGWSFIATAGQEDFLCPGSAGLTVSVSITNVPLEAEDFIHNGDTVTLIEAADEDDIVKITVPRSVLTMQARAADTKFSAVGGGSPDTVSAKLAQFPNPMDFPWSAPANGLTDARAQLALADQYTPLIITGNHRISSNFTFTNRVMFLGRGRLTIDAGVTVTFARGVSAQARQIFYGAGVVAGLADCDVHWFAGDLDGVNSNAIVAIQRAFDACAVNAAVTFNGTYYSDGAPIFVRKGQDVRGSARIAWRSSVANGIHIYDVEGASVHGLSFDVADADILATDGIAFLAGIGAPLSRFSNCIAKRGWIGRASINVSSTMFDAVECYDMRQIGVWAANSDNVRDFASSCSAFSTPIDLSTNAGFQAGESVLFSNGANGAYIYGTSGTRSHIVINDIEPMVGATATGGTSGATAVVTAVHTPHQLGAVRLEGRCEFFRGTASTYAGGKFYITTDAVSDVQGARPYAARFADCDFDSAHLGGSLQKCADFTFSGCYIYSRASYGMTLEGSARYINFNATTIMAPWLEGLLVKSGARGCGFDNGKIIGANRSGLAADGVSIEAGILGFSLRNNEITGPSLGYGGTPVRPWRVAAGATSGLQIGGNLTTGCANTAGSDGSTSGSKTITADIS